MAILAMKTNVMYYSCIVPFQTHLIAHPGLFSLILLDSVKLAIGATEAEGSMFHRPYDVTENFPTSQNQPHFYCYWTFHLI